MRQIEKLTFTDISPKRMDAIRARAKAEGLVLDGSKGLVTWDHGIGIDYAYDEIREVLTVQPAIPFGVTAEMVEGAVSAIVRRTVPGFPVDPNEPLTRDERLTRAALENKPAAPATMIPSGQRGEVVKAEQGERKAPVPA